VERPPVATIKMSRRQLRVQPLGDGLRVSNEGKRALRHNDALVKECVARAGDTLLVDEVVLFLVESRPRALPPLVYHPPPNFGFGLPDAQGMVGESEAAWTLRERLAAVASADVHVLLFGETGVGKELAAQTIHALSRRRAGPLIDRNAATIPPGLIDAELFGHAQDYPERGMPARDGLIASADGGHLLLDEFGQFPRAHQARLLRVLDDGGRLQHLGETRSRRSNFRLIATTNDDPGDLKHDVLARFHLQVEVSGLDQRRSDIPLILRHQLAELAHQVAPLRRAAGSVDPAPPRLAPALVDLLVRHPPQDNARGLARLLRIALMASRGDILEPTRELCAALEQGSARAGFAAADAAPCATATPPSEPFDPTVEQITATLRATRGNASEAARRLGISRYRLYRLMRR
jgi:DNA-binding NtrC family response regulator